VRGTLLSPLAALYGAAVRMRNRRLSRPGAAIDAGVPVLSVGNLTVGGTGKTPMVAWLCRHVLDAGRNPAVVSRGYRGGAGPGPVLVSQGAGPLVGPDLAGDEPHMLARALEGVVVVVGSNRVAGAEEAKRAGADVVVLDDGFQHRRLARDLDIVLVDAGNPFGNSRLLPAGILREPLSSLERADAVIATRCSAGQTIPAIERAVREHGGGVPLFRAGHRAVGFRSGDGRDVAAPERAVAFCGIGNPETFEADVRAQGVEIVEFRAFRDHHAYATEELKFLTAAARDAGADLVTTEKDLARLGAAAAMPGGVKLLVLRIEAEVHDPAPLLRAVRGAIGESD
jgi:tetraacyldisaccharide 4'-kinase